MDAALFVKIDDAGGRAAHCLNLWPTFGVE
jgi:hypothetical protein